MSKILWVVAGALQDDKGQVLLTQRPAGKSMAGLWEFPGGKIEPGETPEQALVRELQEELTVTVSCPDLIPLSFASYGYQGFHLVMPLFLCPKWLGNPTPVEGQNLAWVNIQTVGLEPQKFPMPPADDVLSERLRLFSSL